MVSPYFALGIILTKLAFSTVLGQEEKKVNGPLTTHFQNWLTANGYGDDDFARLDYGTQGSFGGKQNDTDPIVRTPVIFIHGNSDSALAAGFYNGFTENIQYFLDKGYSTSELYATSYGDVHIIKSVLRTHDCNTTARLRRFLMAVKSYTQSEKVHIIGHSMGVTLGRKIILGGPIKASDGNCSIGIPLRFVDVFVGLSGANWGLCNCSPEIPSSLLEPTCNHDNGFWPGDNCGDNLICGAPTMPPCTYPNYAKFLMEMNADFSQLAKRVVSVWSTADDLIMYGDLTWGQPTSRIPRSTDTKVYSNYTHMQTKESPESVADQYKFVNRLD